MRFAERTLLGRGHQGTAEKAWDAHRQAWVCVKWLHEPKSHVDEFGTARLLRHPALASVRDTGIQAGRRYVTYDLVEGQPWQAWSAAQRTPQQVVGVALQVADALSYVHRSGFVHGDVKPDHILVHDDTAVLLDFGLTRTHGQYVQEGTLGFLSPEVLGARAPVQPTTDLFALAMSTLSCLGATLPSASAFASRKKFDLWNRAQRQKLSKGLDPSLVDACMAGVCFDPQQRPSLSVWTENIAGAARLPPPHPKVPSLFVGREPELERLRSLWQQAADQHVVQTTVISGPSGMGKTELAKRHEGDVQQLGGRVYAGAHAGQDALVELAKTLKVSLDENNLEPSFEKLLEKLGALGPTLVWFEDLKAADELVWDFVRYCMGQSQLRRLGLPHVQSAVQVLVTTQHPTIEQGHGLVLQSLAPQEVSRWLECALGLTDAALHRRVYDFSRGYPQLLRAWAQLAERSTAYGISVAKDAPSNTDPLRHLAQELVASMDNVQREALFTLACVDEPLSSTIWNELGLSTKALDMLHKHDLIQERDDALWVAAPGMRYGIASLDTDAGQRHKRLAKLLASSQPLSAQVHTFIASPQNGAGQLKESLQRVLNKSPWRVLRVMEGLAHRVQGPQLDRLGDVQGAAYSRLGEHTKALQSYQRARKAGVPIDDATYVEALLCCGRYPEAIAWIGDSQQPPLIVCLARAKFYIGEYRQALELVTPLRQESLDASLRWRVPYVAGLSQLYLGDTETACTLLEQSLAWARHVDHAAVTEASGSLAIALQRHRRFNDAKRMYLESYDAAKRLGDRSKQITRLINLGTMEHDRQVFAEAMAVFERALRMAAQGFLKREMVRASYNLANTMTMLGELTRATELCQRAHKDAEGMGATVEAGYIRCLLAEIANERGDSKGALKILNGLGDMSDPALAADVNARRAMAAYVLSAEAPLSWDAITVHDDPRVVQWMGLGAASEANITHVRKCEAALHQASELWKSQAVLAHLASFAGDRAAVAKAVHQAKEGLSHFLQHVPEAQRRSYVNKRSVRIFMESIQNLLQDTFDEPRASNSDSERQLRRLLRINARLARHTELRPLLELILDEAIDLAEAERGFILLEEGKRPLQVMAARNMDTQTLKKPEAKISQSIARQVVEHGAPVVTIDAMEDERFREQQSVNVLGLRSVVCVPLEDEGRAIGALYLDNRFRPQAFSDDMTDLLGSFAAQASLAIRQARMAEQLRRQRDELEDSAKRLEQHNLGLQQEMEQTAQALAQAHRALSVSKQGGKKRKELASIVGSSAQMQRVFELVEQLAPTPFSVFICGESGTGKELVARALHDCSDRHRGPFVAINCAALPENLVESELFGVTKGAYTGATSDRAGLFELADKGTLFLDEIGDMPIGLQVKLLRVLENKTFRPLGGTQDRRTDVRVVSASHKNLGQLVEEGKFRKDLFYRLNTATIALAPLRDRPADLSPLVSYLLERACRDAKRNQVPEVSPAAMKLLMNYNWPGNVRELDNELRRALVFVGDGPIEGAHFSEALRHVPAIANHVQTSGGFRAAVANFEKRLLLATLQGCQWDPQLAASQLGLSRSVFYEKMRRYDLKREGRDGKVRRTKRKARAS